MAGSSRLKKYIEKLGPPGQLPGHVAVIMDGNARWARENDVELSQGHREGAARAREITEFCRRVDGISALSLFAFSTENWERPETEINTLFDLLVEFLHREATNLVENNIRLRILGKLDELPDRVTKEVSDICESTSDNSDFTLNIALNYGARNEIIRAVKELVAEAEAGQLQPGDVAPDVFRERLDTSGQPDPDFLIRTSNEQRLSNFLLWQIAYSELYFTETLWPDFSGKAFFEALNEFLSRERRFGRRKSGGE